MQFLQLPDLVPGERGTAHLALLARVKEAQLTAHEIPPVAVENIRPFTGQPRKYFNPVSLMRLARSIDSGGQQQPGILHRNPQNGVEYELIDGERRWRAINMIPLARRPPYIARLIHADDEVVRFIVSGVTNFNRDPHTSLEVLETIENMRRSKIPMEEIADLLGISVPWAYSIQNLKKLPTAVLEMLDPELPKDEQLPISAAIQISKYDSPAEQLQMAQRVVNREVRVANVRSEVVRAAKESGTPIRMRARRPHEEWDMFRSNVGTLRNAIATLRNALDEPLMVDSMHNRPNEAKGLRLMLTEAQDDMKSLLSKFDRAKRKS